MKRRVIAGIATIGAAGAMMVAATGVGAQEINNRSTLVDRISERFGLNHDEVESVFQEHRAVRHDQMEVRFEEKLDELVSTGKLTLEEADRIEALHEVHVAERESYVDLDPQERREAMKDNHEDMKDLFEELGLELGDLGTGKGKFGRSHRGAN